MKICLILLFLAMSVPAEKPAKAPGIGGIRVGLKKDAALALLKTSPVFKDCETVLDSNALMIASKKDKWIKVENVKIASLKCMFNKKPDIQAVSVIFPAANNDELAAVYALAEKIMGRPRETTSDKVGFRFEAEWRTGKYSGTFFASDVDFEAYLLMAFTRFVKEEERRGARMPR
jgi:hypothetical protein